MLVHVLLGSVLSVLGEQGLLGGDTTGGSAHFVVVVVGSLLGWLVTLLGGLLLDLLSEVIVACVQVVLDALSAVFSEDNERISDLELGLSHLEGVLG